MSQPAADGEPNVPTRNVGRTALILAPIALVARGVAFIVPMLIAALYGAEGITDAFFYALAFPTFIMVVVANAVGTVVTPILARMQADEPEHVRRFVGSAIVAAALLAAAVGLGLLGALRPLMPIITSFSPEVQHLSWTFVAELLPFMSLIGVSVILRASCEVRGRFVPVALAPLLRGSTVIAAVLALRGPLGPHVLPVAMLLGQVVEVVWLAILLAQSGLIPKLSLVFDARLREAARSSLPLLGGEVLIALNVVLDKAFAGALPEGSVSLLEYADRTRFIPQTLLESTLIPVAFATWANLAARQEREVFSHQVDQSLRWIAAWTAAPLAGLYIGRHVLTAWLYQRGEFTAADAAASADAFGWYVPGVWAMMLGTLAMRAHVVERRLGLVFGLGVLSVVLNTTLNAILVVPMGINGLALASTITWWIVPALYLLTLWPTIRSAATLRQWLPVGLVVGSAAAIATGLELGGLTPHSLADPALLGAALPCFGLLAIAFVVTRPPRRA